MKDIDNINYINNLNKKMLSPLMTKNNIHILPKLKIYKKKLNKSSDIKQEIGINKDKKSMKEMPLRNYLELNNFLLLKRNI